MNKKLHKLLVAVPVAVAVTAGGIRIAADYQKDGFQPFATDNQLKNDQLLFADNNASVGAQQKKPKTIPFGSGMTPNRSSRKPAKAPAICLNSRIKRLPAGILSPAKAAAA